MHRNLVVCTPLPRRQVKPKTTEDFITPITAIFREEAISGRVTFEQIVGASRRADVVLARHKGMWRAFRELGVSTVRIGRACGHRDHTTVMYAIRKMERLYHEVLHSAPVDGHGADDRAGAQPQACWAKLAPDAFR